MSRNQKEGSNIPLPWDELASPSNVIRCPKCGNDGMDGSITGMTGQWGIQRKCLKNGCNQTWSGGIGVQQADFTEAPAIPGVERKDDLEAPLVQYTGGQYRDPNKNHDEE